jgi:hypothetical protein
MDSKKTTLSFESDAEPAEPRGYEDSALLNQEHTRANPHRHEEKPQSEPLPLEVLQDPDQKNDTESNPVFYLEGPSFTVEIPGQKPRPILSPSRIRPRRRPSSSPRYHPVRLDEVEVRPDPSPLFYLEGPSFTVEDPGQQPRPILPASIGRRRRRSSSPWPYHPLKYEDTDDEEEVRSNDPALQRMDEIEVHADQTVYNEGPVVVQEKTEADNEQSGGVYRSNDSDESGKNPKKLKTEGSL